MSCNANAQSLLWGTFGTIWASSFLVCEQDSATAAEEHEIELSLLTHYILLCKESLGIKDVRVMRNQEFICIKFLLLCLSFQFSIIQISPKLFKNILLL